VACEENGGKSAAYCCAIIFLVDQATDKKNLSDTQVLHGHGLLGREDGLYGAVSFAYQG
jgi:hypothetical protein